MKLPLEQEEYEKLQKRLSKILEKKVICIHDIVKSRVKYESGYATKMMIFTLDERVPQLTNKEIEALCERNSYNFGFRLEKDEKEKYKVYISTD